MDIRLAKLFPKTEDAIKVNEYFGSDMTSHSLLYVLVRGRQEDVLKAIEEKEKAKIAKVG